MQKTFSYLLKPIHYLTLRQAILIIVPALSTICWIVLLLLIYKQFASIGFARYVDAQKRLINSFINANITTLKLHDSAEIQRNMASLEYGSGRSITAIIDGNGEYLLGHLDEAGEKYKQINNWVKSNDLKNRFGGKKLEYEGTGYFVFQEPIYDPSDSRYLGTLISFINDDAFIKQEATTKKTLLIVGIILLIIQTSIILLIINAIVAPIEAISHKASEHKDIFDLSKELSSFEGAYTKDIAALSESLASTMAKHTVDITLGRLTSQLAHDMRSPLSVLKAYAQDNSLHDMDDNDRAIYQDSAIRCVNRLNDMADELLNYSRSRDVKRHDTDIAASVRGVIADSKISAKEKSVDFIYKGPDELIASVDELKIVRVLTNIVVNGIQAIPETGSITVTTDIDTERNLFISIMDTGTGIKPEHLPKIFNQTFTYGKKGGLGLGLAFCYNVIKAHSGQIDVSSQLGRGTEFSIVIPSC